MSRKIRPIEPEMPDSMIKATGLRTGFTTGSCAQSATLAAIELLRTGSLPESVEVILPRGERVSFAVVPADPSLSPSRYCAGAAVIKDAGDDPDCTDGAMINVFIKPSERTELKAGYGVGTVTLSGLGLEINGPSVTRVPRQMILKTAAEHYKGDLEITIACPTGIEMAKETTNERLGIVGGISILGTTGIVRPFSTASYRASVVQQIKLAGFQGSPEVILATGYLTTCLAEKLNPHLEPYAFVEVGDFSGVAFKQLKACGYTSAKFYIMGGKLVKIASGIMMTHYSKSRVSQALLKQVSETLNLSKELAEAAVATNTARHFVETCLAHGDLRALSYLCGMAKTNVSTFVNGLEVDFYLVDFEGKTVIACS